MFTSRVHTGEVFEILALDNSISDGGGCSITIGKTGSVLIVCKNGDSISVNVELPPETLRRTNLGELKIGDKVNLVRPLTSSFNDEHFLQHKCDICQRSYNRLEHLVRHSRVHTGEKKSHECNWGRCTKKFSRSDQLTRHRRTHNNNSLRHKLKLSDGSSYIRIGGVGLVVKTIMPLKESGDKYSA
ncbi:167_t:CDS:2 [Entrophospora sp. SA101]|nr:16176_t:CDS:2 [Entrophospora sp. SA101]CAJ0754219.1 167_t:CDS:2 [Entrophospora sp. SA101]CAJ0831159.1 13493_t:CDS:2 [Entrophospora sp. SA101]CAJ0831176.1 13499_t:CDS:2 [Entrophospora sp. SA101]CAJ0840307.1 1441_t:CDS:2 [Entrophospora sp. SA101]